MNSLKPHKQGRLFHAVDFVKTSGRKGFGFRNKSAGRNTIERISGLGGINPYWGSDIYFFSYFTLQLGLKLPTLYHQTTVRSYRNSRWIFSRQYKPEGPEPLVVSLLLQRFLSISWLLIEKHATEKTGTILASHNKDTLSNHEHKGRNILEPLAFPR